MIIFPQWLPNFYKYCIYQYRATQNRPNRAAHLEYLPGNERRYWPTDICY